MVRNLPWLLAVALVLIFASYLVLTVGTVVLLPREWQAIEKGMSREEVKSLVPGIQEEIQQSPSQEDLHVANVSLGLRRWTLVVWYEDGRVVEVERRGIDPHFDGRNRGRSAWGISW